MQEAFPRMRSDVVAEQRRVLAPPHAVVAAVLLVGPAGGQVGDASISSWDSSCAS